MTYYVKKTKVPGDYADLYVYVYLQTDAKPTPLLPRLQLSSSAPATPELDLAPGEIEWKAIQLERDAEGDDIHLGRGSFGPVLRGIFNEQSVAVKVYIFI